MKENEKKKLNTKLIKMYLLWKHFFDVKSIYYKVSKKNSIIYAKINK